MILKVKKISIITILSLIAVLLISCSEEISKYNGKWTLEKAVVGSISLGPVEVGEMSFEIKPDHKITRNFGGKKIEAKWNDVKNGIEIQEGGKVTATLKEYKGKKLRMELEDTVFIFKKK